MALKSLGASPRGKKTLAPKPDQPTDQVPKDDQVDDQEQDPGAVVHQTLDEHHKTIHKHLKAAHTMVAHNPEGARHHINAAGMVAKALHKTAKTAASANGNEPGNDSESTGTDYQGNNT
jgi:hypothetical protein